MRIGIIAEDKSDVDVIGEFTLALLKPHKVGFNHFVGDGCGKLRRKWGAWAETLVRQGCAGVIVIHDLDDFNEGELRGRLTKAVASAHPRSFIVLIPKREIEAWLLYDSAAIAGVFKSPKPPNLPGDPESLDDPKEHLETLVRKNFKKRYINTIHNLLIAKRMQLASLNKSKSFSQYPKFAAELKTQAARLSKGRARRQLTRR